MGRRKAGTGTVRLRKDGRWEGWILLGQDENGKTKRKNVLAHTKKECIRKLEELQKNLQGSSHKVQSGMTFGQWLDFWYTTYCKPGIRPNTQKCYENRIYNHIIPGLGNIPLRKLEKKDLQKFYLELKQGGRLTNEKLYGQGLSDRSVRACHTTCHGALEKAVLEKQIPRNPANGCMLPPKKSKEMQVLTKEEMVRFLIQAKEDDFYELALLELSTGLRRGEICGLKWNDLNLETGELQVRRQAGRVDGKVQLMPLKTKSAIRSMILPPAVTEVLRQRKNESQSELLFPSPLDGAIPIDPRSIHRTMKKILKRAQCREVRFHDLRHTFATTALENGMDIKTLSVIIGHVSAATTIDVYSHITQPMQENAARKIDQGFGTVSPGEPPETACSEQGSGIAQKPKFTAQKGKIRKPGTGCVYRINDHLYEGKYSPTNAEGKRERHNVYGHTEEECEAKLAVMIQEVKDRIQREKADTKLQRT